MTRRHKHFPAKGPPHTIERTIKPSEFTASSHEVFRAARNLLLCAGLTFLTNAAQAQFNFSTSNGAATITGYTGNGGAVTIPSTITVLPGGHGADPPTTITVLPVTSIGDTAFSGQTTITSISVPSSVASIGDRAFAGCSSMASATIPNSVTNIGNSAFSGCSDLTSVTLPNNITSIENGVFYNCSSLSNITIPSTVTSIGGEAFEGCSSMASVTIPNSVTSLGFEAFYNCSSLVNVIIPDSVTSIGDSAFENCTSLPSVTIPNSVTSLGNDLLYGCSNLVSVTIPNSVTSIGYDTFAYCSNLSSVNIPSSVTSIGFEAFYGCSSMTTVTIPNNIPNIGAYAFANCTSLTSAYFQGSLPGDWGELFGGDSSVIAYYLPGNSSWGAKLAGLPTVMMATPIINNGPAIEAVVTGNNATFSVASSGVPAPTVQWQVSTDGGNSWTNVSGSQYAGATTGTLTIAAPSTALLGYQYQAVVSNPAGSIETQPVPLVVGTSTAKLAWLQSNFSPTQLGQPSVVGDLATPTNDGIPNLIKYAFNLIAQTNGQGQMPPPTIVNGLPSLTFAAPQSDVTYTVEASADLVNWSTTKVTTQTKGSQVTASYNQIGVTPVFLQLVVAPAQ